MVKYYGGIQGPVDSLNIVETYMDGDKKVERSIGGTSIEYLVDAGPNKFLVGTEKGSVITASKRANKPIEIIQRYGTEGEYHLGPVYSVHRSPPNYRFFLTVGDWGAKIWNEDLKSPIIATRYHNAFLADGCFSPVRPGLFFLIRKDGQLDIWDYYYRQNELAFSHKVSEVPLSCIKLNFIQNVLGYQNGKYACIGDQDGTVTLMELCESLYTLQPNEKEIMAEMFDRETRKEKALELKHKAEELKKQAQQKEKKNLIKVDLEKKKQNALQKAENDFYKIIEEDKKYYEEQLDLKLDYKGSSQQQQKQQKDESVPQQQQLQEEEELQQIDQKEPSIHKEEQQQQEQQEPVQQQEPEIQQEQQQPEEIKQEEPVVQQAEEKKEQEQAIVEPKEEEQQQSAEQQQELQEQQQQQQEEEQQQPIQEDKPQEQS